MNERTRINAQECQTVFPIHKIYTHNSNMRGRLRPFQIVCMECVLCVCLEWETGFGLHWAMNEKSQLNDGNNWKDYTWKMNNKKIWIHGSQQLMNNVLEIATQMLEFHTETHTHTHTGASTRALDRMPNNRASHCNHNRVREFGMLITSSTKLTFSIGNIHSPQSFVRGAQWTHQKSIHKIIPNRITKMHYAHSIEFFLFFGVHFIFVFKKWECDVFILKFSICVRSKAFFGCAIKNDSTQVKKKMKEKSHTKNFKCSNIVWKIATLRMVFMFGEYDARKLANIPNISKSISVNRLNLFEHHAHRIHTDCTQERANICIICPLVVRWKKIIIITNYKPWIPYVWTKRIRCDAKQRNFLWA